MSPRLSILEGSTFPRVVQQEPRVEIAVNRSLALYRAAEAALKNLERKWKPGDELDAAIAAEFEKATAALQQLELENTRTLDERIAAKRVAAQAVPTVPDADKAMFPEIREVAREMPAMKRDGWFQRNTDPRVAAAIAQFPADLGLVSEPALRKGIRNVWAAQHPDDARELADLEGLREAFSFVFDSVRRGLREMVPDRLVARQPFARL